MGILPVRLLTQYRMHPVISCWPNEAFYEGTCLFHLFSLFFKKKGARFYSFLGHLNNGVKEAERIPPAGFPWPAAGPACFVPMECYEDNVQGKSKRNSHEAAAVVRIVDLFLLGGEVAPGDIGVVTPYVGQVAFPLLKFTTTVLVLYFRVEIDFQVRRLRQLFGDNRRRRRPGEVENEELGVVVEEGRYANLEIMSVDGYQGRSTRKNLSMLLALLGNLDQ